jgi:uncharacterized Rmd1/YagE family protein
MPLLPGYGPGINVRSSALPAPPSPTAEAEDPVTVVSEAEESADDAGYFSGRPTSSSVEPADGVIDATPPGMGSVSEPVTPTMQTVIPSPAVEPNRRSPSLDPESFAEVVFFTYGVVVFFGFNEAQEHSILEDIETSEIMQKPLREDRWEIEECHYEVSST